MSEVGLDRRFADALSKARADWAAADSAACAQRAGCELTPSGVLVPFLGTPHLVSHPLGEVSVAGPAGVGGEPAEPAAGPVHVAVTVLLLHYLMTAGGAPIAGRWVAYRELPGCLFYAAAFAGRAEAPLTRAFAAGGEGGGLPAFSRAAAPLGGEALALADAAFSFVALPRLPVAVLIWEGDDEQPGEARLLLDAGATGYLPPEDLAGVGGMLARRLTAPAA